MDQVWLESSLEYFSLTFFGCSWSDFFSSQQDLASSVPYFGLQELLCRSSECCFCFEPLRPRHWPWGSELGSVLEWVDILGLGCPKCGSRIGLEKELALASTETPFGLAATASSTILTHWSSCWPYGFSPALCAWKLDSASYELALDQAEAAVLATFSLMRLRELEGL